MGSRAGKTETGTDRDRQRQTETGRKREGSGSLLVKSVTCYCANNDGLFEAWYWVDDDLKGANACGVGSNG